MSLKDYIEHTNLVKRWEDGFFPDYNNFYADEFFEDEFITNKFGKKLLCREVQGLYMSLINPFRTNKENINHNILYRLPRGEYSSIDTIFPINISNLKEYIGNMGNLVPEEDLEKYIINYPNHRVWNGDTLKTCKELNWFNNDDLKYLKERNILTEIPSWFKV